MLSSRGSLQLICLLDTDDSGLQLSEILCHLNAQRGARSDEDLHSHSSELVLVGLVRGNVQACDLI